MKSQIQIQKIHNIENWEKINKINSAEYKNQRLLQPGKQNKSSLVVMNSNGQSTLTNPPERVLTSEHKLISPDI